MPDQPQLQAQAPVQQTAGQIYQAMHPKLQVPGENTTESALTAFVFGDFGTRKTTIAATFPNPLFLACQMEGGDVTLCQMPHLYGLPVPPIWPIKCVQDMQQAVLWIEQNARRQGFCTIVVDSLSYYVDLWISEMGERRKRTAPGGLDSADAMQMRKQDWGFLEYHIIKEVAKRLHSTGLNVIWTCTEKKLTKANDKEGTTDIVGLEPYTQGAAGKKLPGLCDFIIQAAKQVVPDTALMGRGKHDVIWWLAPSFQAGSCRHRFGDLFPEGRLVPAPGRQVIDFWSFFHRIPNNIYLGQNKQAYFNALQQLFQQTR